LIGGYYHNQPFITWLHATSSVLTKHISEEKTMKPVKNFLFAALLVCSMALTSYAGEIDTPGKTNPTPPSTTIDSTNEDSSAPTSGSETTVTYSETDNLLYDALTMICSIF